LCFEYSLVWAGALKYIRATSSLIPSISCFIYLLPYHLTSKPLHFVQYQWVTCISCRSRWSLTLCLICMPLTSLIFFNICTCNVYVIIK
jgi:hypothetical protein